MTKRIKVDELPVFDATSYLDSEQAIAAYLTDILQANDAGLVGEIRRIAGAPTQGGAPVDRAALKALVREVLVELLTGK